MIGHRIRLPSGEIAIVCGGRARAARCSVAGCRKGHTKLCDEPVEGGTCDARLCDAHATSTGDDTDVCPAHVRTSPPPNNHAGDKGDNRP